MSVENVILIKGFKPCRWPIRFDIPSRDIVVVEAVALASYSGLVCVIAGWRDRGHYEWLIYAADGIKCHQFSSSGFGSPEVARREGLAILRQWVLEMRDEELGLDDLRELIASQADVKQLLNVTCRQCVYFYQIETPFDTFPKFVIGETTAGLETGRPIHKCSARENSDRAWECLMKTGSLKGLYPEIEAGKETAADA